MGEKDGSECDRGDESRGCGIGERGFRIECGVATAGMGPQPGDLRDEHALRQQRDVFESISSHENSIGLLTTESVSDPLLLPMSSVEQLRRESADLASRLQWYSRASNSMSPTKTHGFV